MNGLDIGVGKRRLAIGIALSLSAAVLLSFPAFAQNLKYDSSLPIEITADSLEVAQEDQIATFAGDVDAIQGDLVLSADQLRVYYEGKGSDVGAAAGTTSAIRQIEAEGDVILASPEETARGDNGHYDVTGRLITLVGSVVLTKDENVVRGERLVLDLVTGKSRMIGTDTPVASNAEGSSSRRVRALFTPKSKSTDQEPTSEELASDGAAEEVIGRTPDEQAPHIPAARPE
ncbi:MAG: lipopolysaccharide transport periplasmic protein LptA [Geminicoccaceae bacterium]